MVSTTNFVSYWALEDLTDSHGSNDLTNHSAASGATGIVDNCYDFERSSSNYLDTSLTFPTGSFSFGGWVKTESSNNYQKLGGIDKSESGSHGVMGIEQSSAGHWQFFVVNTSNSFYGSDGTTSISTGTWYFVVGTYNDSTGEIITYVNGSAEGSSATLSGTRATASGNMLIGAGIYNSIGNYFDGLIDEAFLYDGVLSATDVSDIWASGSCLPYPFAGGSALESDIDDSFTITDIITSNHNIVYNIKSDTITVTDAATTIHSLTYDMPDSFTITDEVSGLSVLTSAISDNLLATDDTDSVIAILAAIQDTFILSDQILAEAVKVVTIADSFTITDALTGIVSEAILDEATAVTLSSGQTLTLIGTNDALYITSKGKTITITSSGSLSVSGGDKTINT